MEKDRKTRTSITIDPVLLERLRSTAKRKKISVSKLIEEAAFSHLAVLEADSNGVGKRGEEHVTPV